MARGATLQIVYDDPWSEAAYPLDTNPELWERLIRGDCARVVVLSPTARRSMIELYFPQTLGLPPLRRFSSRLTSQELAAEATTLAAGDRWIVEGEIWAEHFLPRAEAVISIETDRVAAMAPQTRRRMYIDLDTVLKWIERTRAKRRQRKASAGSHTSPLDAALTARTPSTNGIPKPTSVAIAEDEYPDKLIRVTTRAQVRALRTLRAGD